MHPPAAAVLIGGTSHVGKSTCAARLGAALHWPVIATDKLGRHPGRPWTGVPPHVSEFYLSLSDDAVHWFQKVHHHNMRPAIREALRRAESGGPFILEGSALRPGYRADWTVLPAVAVCLYAEDDAVRERILFESDYARQPEPIQRATHKFITRSVRENRALAEEAKQNGVQLIDTTDVGGADRAADHILSMLSP